MQKFNTAPTMHYATACKEILELAKTLAVPYTKLETENIVVPSLKKYGFIANLVPGVITTEEPGGHLYPTGLMVTRVVEGRVVIDDDKKGKDNQYDTYAWKVSTVQDYIDKGNYAVIGRHSPEGLNNFAKLHSTLKTELDREKFCEGFMPWGIDLILIHTEEEHKMCIEVTQELYDAGLRYWADDWRNDQAEKDPNGMVSTTALEVGDILVISDIGAYVVARNIVKKTYRKD